MFLIMKLLIELSKIIIVYTFYDGQYEDFDIDIFI
jgi:hypothetical protein